MITPQEQLDRINKGADPKFIKMVEDYFSRPVICINLFSSESTEEEEEDGWQRPIPSQKRLLEERQKKGM